MSQGPKLVNGTGRPAALDCGSGSPARSQTRGGARERGITGPAHLSLHHEAPGVDHADGEASKRGEPAARRRKLGFAVLGSWGVARVRLGGEG